MRQEDSRQRCSDAARTTKGSSARIVKVFISSTFRDFQKERDELVKKTFPAVRDYCARRHIIFIDVDLRWGITEEQAEAGEILPICLAEIDNCRPYFLGLLGERYGWVPGHIPAELTERHPWLREHQTKSITELEMLYGAIRNNAVEGRRFFYFRSPSYHLALSPDEQGDCVSDDAVAAGKLERLKEQIRDEARHHRLKLTESYRDPCELAELVFEHLKQAIAVDFPEEEYDELKNERLAHQAFVDSRAGILVERTPMLDDLVRRLSGPTPPVVVSGPSGSGKTSLLVSLALRLTEAHPQAYVFANFVGASARSTDHVQIIRRLLVEMIERYGLDDHVPEGSAEMVELFSYFFERLPTQPTAFGLLDGLDQIADVDEALTYAWLPERFPDNVRLVLSVSSTRAAETFSKRGWPVLDVRALTPAEQRQIIDKYLGRYGKRLDAVQTVTVLGVEQTSSPLYLRTLLEEIRIFGDFAGLNDRISYYLASRDAVALYDKILQRLEVDYDGGNPGLVRRAFSLLATSRFGLTEAELRDMLGVPRAVWSQLHLAVQESLSNTIGYITFFHEFLRRAVENRYLDTEEARRAAHLCLAECFAGTSDLDRRVEELPWQLEQAGEWERLKDCLSQLDIFLKLMPHDRQRELMSYWRALEPRYSVTETYAQALRCYEATNPGGSALRLRMEKVSQFLWSCGFIREAAALREKVKGLDDEDMNVSYLGELQESRIHNLLTLAGNLVETGQLEQAEAYVLQAREILASLPAPDSALHARLLNNLAYVQKAMKRYEEAEQNYRAAITLDPEPAYRGNLATLLKDLGQAEEAERLYRSILDELPESDPTRAAFLANLGDILLENGEMGEAERCYRSAIDINRDRLGPNHHHLAFNLCRYAGLLMLSMRSGEAEEVMDEAIPILEATLGPDHERTKDAHMQREQIRMLRAVQEQLEAVRSRRRDHPQ